MHSHKTCMGENGCGLTLSGRGILAPLPAPFIFPGVVCDAELKFDLRFIPES